VRTVFFTGGARSLFQWALFGINAAIALFTLVAMVLAVRRKAIFMPIFYVTSGVRFILMMSIAITPFFLFRSAAFTGQAWGNFFSVSCYALLLSWLPLFFFRHSPQVRVYMGSDGYITKYPWVKRGLGTMKKSQTSLGEHANDPENDREQ